MVQETAYYETRHDERAGKISWGAIFCGGFVTLGSLLLFAVLGSAIGLSIFNPQEQGGGIGTGVGIGAGIYLLLTVIISFFIGGYAASRMGWVVPKLNATFQGVTTWALVSSFFLFMIGSGVSALVGGVFNVAKTGAQAAVSTPEGKQQAGSAIEQLTERSKSLLKKSDASKKSDSAKQSSGMTSEQQQAAQTATSVAARGSWLAFFSLLLSCLAAIGGALVGSPGPRRAAARSVDRRAA